MGLPRHDQRAGVRRLMPMILVSGALALAVGCQSAASPSPGSPATPSPGGATPSSSASSPTAPPSAGPSSGTPHWEPAGEMAKVRPEPRAVPLGSGRVVVLGNSEASDRAQLPLSGETWDPATGAWTAIEDMSKARRDFAAVAMADDRVLVTGGLNDDEPRQSYSSAYIYDARPGHEAWTKTGLMSVARTGPSAATLPDGRVLVAGGYFHVAPFAVRDGGGDVVLAAYHPDADAGSPSAALGLYDIDMGSAGAALATAELFDPATGTWSATGPMRYARYGAPAVALGDGRILVVGSRSDSQGFSIEVDERAFVTAEIYDPATGRFTLAGELPPIDRAAIEAAGEPGANPMPEDDGQLLDVGSLVPTRDGGAVLIGQTRWWKHYADLTRSFRFDAGSGSWSEIGRPWAFVGEPAETALTTPGVRNVSGSSVATMRDGRVLVAGGGGNSPDGYGGRHAAETAELYDPATNTWTELPPMPEGRSAGAVATLADGSVIVAGGTVFGPDGFLFLTSAVRLVP